MGTTDVGAQLRSSREALGLSIASLAQRTRVQPRIIAAIEQNDLSSIPPKPYGRGFIRAYAREVGIDPEQAVHDYFAQFAPVQAEPQTAHEPQPWPARGSWLLTAGTLVAVLVLLAVFQGNETDADGAREPAAVGTSGTGTEPTPMSDANARPYVPLDATAREAARGRDAQSTADAPLTLAVEADRLCWIAARADGERVLYELLQPGTTRTIRAARELTIRAGDAGALRISLNGESKGVFGADGEVRTARFTSPQ